MNDGIDGMCVLLPLLQSSCCCHACDVESLGEGTGRCRLSIAMGERCGRLESTWAKADSVECSSLPAGQRFIALYDRASIFLAFSSFSDVCWRRGHDTREGLDLFLG